MAILRVRSTDGSDADNGSTWALAKATLAGAFAAASAGDTIYVSQAHAETQASAMTLTSPGTLAAPCIVICVDDGADPATTLATTATISTTAAASNITIGGFAYFYGITFNAGNAANQANIASAAADKVLVFDTCKLVLNNTSTSSRLNIGSGSLPGGNQLTVLKNTTFTFGSASQGVNIVGEMLWLNTASALVGTIPTTLFLTKSIAGLVTLRGVDLSAAGSGKTLWAVNSELGHARMLDCKLGASVSVTSSTVASQSSSLEMVNCDPSLNYRYYRETYSGTVQHEATIVRTGGSTDGTTPFSRKMVSTANAKFTQPLESRPVTFWNNTTGSSMTVEAEVVTDNVTLTDAEAWIEVEYLGTAGVPLASTVSDRTASIIDTPANQTTSSVTWTTTGLATPVKQTLSVSFTPQLAGPIRALVMLAKASTTMYVDQLRLSTSGRQYMAGFEGIINEGAGGGLLTVGGMAGGMQRT